MSKSPIADAALNTHLGILGKTGSGKTFTAKGLVERLLTQRRQVVIVDPTGAWYGLRTGFEIPIFGGRNGDIEINDKAGAAVASVIVGQQTSAIVDLSLMSGGAQRRFMTAFAHALRAKPPGAIWLVLDEADEFLPQQLQPDMMNLFGDLKWMVRRGRLNGFRVMMITQRPAEIAKAVLTQIETLVAHRLTAPQDRKAIEEWVKGHHDAAEAKEVLSSLASLERGVAWVWAPDLSILAKQQMPPITTFDSSRTPEPGETAVAAPALAALDMSAIRAAMVPSEPIPKDRDDAAKAGTVVGDALKERDDEIARLKAELASLRADWACRGEQIDREKARADHHSRALERIQSGIGATLAAFGNRAAAPMSMPSETAKAKQPTPPPATASGSTLAVTGPQRQLLGVLAWWAAHGHPEPTRAQVAAMAGWKITSGHLKNVAGSARTAGLIDYPQPGRFGLTAAGAAEAPSPDLTADFHDRLRSTLTGPQRQVFDVLLDRGQLSRKDVAEANGWEPTSGHVKNVLGSMRTLELIDYPAPGEVALQAWAKNE